MGEEKRKEKRSVIIIYCGKHEGGKAQELRILIGNNYEKGLQNGSWSSWTVNPNTVTVTKVPTVVFR